MVPGMVTTKQSQLLDFVQAVRRETGRWPRVKDCAEHFKVTAATMSRRLKLLRDRGLIGGTGWRAEGWPSEAGPWRKLPSWLTARTLYPVTGKKFQPGVGIRDGSLLLFDSRMKPDSRDIVERAGTVWLYTELPRPDGTARALIQSLEAVKPGDPKPLVEAASIQVDGVLRFVVWSPRITEEAENPPETRAPVPKDLPPPPKTPAPQAPPQPEPEPETPPEPNYDISDFFEDEPRNPEEE